jgi:YidC/Oxa1 family membrane protein insertase
VEIFDAFRDALYSVLKFFQNATEPVLGGQSFWFSIVLLTISVRLVLIPLTVKQVRSTRVMQELQPELKKLQAKYKNDKQKLQEELMKLYRERGFNPLAGCWPLAAQLPFFWALYRVIYSKNIGGAPNILLGKTFFGVPLEDRWSTLSGWGEKLASGPGLTILFLIIAMAVTTYISQRQLMAKQATEVNPQQQMLLRLMPLLFVIFAVNVPLAVVLYWVTTNLWSMGQQWVLLRNYQSPAAAAAPAATGTAATDGQGQTRKGLGALAAFRSLVQPSEASKPRQQQSTAKNGSGGAGSGKSRSAPPRGQQSRRQQPRARQGGARQPGTQQPRAQQAGGQEAGGQQPRAQQAGGQEAGGQQPRAQQAGGQEAGGQQPRAQQAGGQQAGGAAKEGGEARSRQAGRPGAGGGRKPGSGGRPTGRGKSGGQQRRSKR